jgi:hypothetical protein
MFNWRFTSGVFLSPYLFIIMGDGPMRQLEEAKRLGKFLLFFTQNIYLAGITLLLSTLVVEKYINLNIFYKIIGYPQDRI